jgi:hypothetical protein
MARVPAGARGQHGAMADVVVLLAVAAVLALLGVLAGHGWAADSRDPEWARPTFAPRDLR